MKMLARLLPPTCLARFASVALLSLPLLGTAQMETGQWKTKTKGQPGQMLVFYPTPTATSGNPELLVIPLLGPERRLLPGGKLQVWVGRADGSPLANASVTIRVPSPGNTLVSSGSRVTEVICQTNAAGIAEVLLAAPEIPPDSSNGSGGGGGGPVAT